MIIRPDKTGAFPLPRPGLPCAGKCGWKLDSWGYFWLGNGPFCYRCSVDRAKHIDYADQYHFREDPYRLTGLEDSAHYSFLPDENQYLLNQRYGMPALFRTRAKS